MKRKLIVLGFAAVCLVFLSGISVGVAGRRANDHLRFRSSLVEQLDLTPDQRRQVRRVWDELLEEGPPPPVEELRKAERQRQREVDALLTPEQRARYEEIQRRFDARVDELDRPGRARFARAEEETRRLLTPAQREQYDRLLSERKKSMFFIRLGGPSTQEH